MIIIEPQPQEPPEDGAREQMLQEVCANPSKYLLIIDRDLCIGAATCVDLAPKTYALDDENKAVILAEPWGEDDQMILDAAKSCPTLAVIVKDRATGEQVFPA